MNIEKIEKKGTICAIIRSDEVVITDSQSVSRQDIFISMFFQARAHVPHPQQLLKRENMKDDSLLKDLRGFVPATIPIRISSLNRNKISSIYLKKLSPTTQSSYNIIPYCSVSNIQSIAVFTPFAQPRLYSMNRVCTSQSQSILSIID